MSIVRRTRFALGAALAMSMIVAVLGSSAAAQQPQVSVDVVIDGDELTLALSDVQSTVGALELEIDGLPDLDDECTLTEGIGACNNVEGTTTFVALNPTGWSTDMVLLTADLESSVDPDDLDIRLIRVTDLEGIDLAATVGGDGGAGATADGDAGSSLIPIVVILALIATLGVGYGVLRSRNVADPVD